MLSHFFSNKPTRHLFFLLALTYSEIVSAEIETMFKSVTGIPEQKNMDFQPVDPKDPTVVRSRILTLVPSYFNKTTRNLAMGGVTPSSLIRLNLFENKILLLNLKETPTVNDNYATSEKSQIQMDNNKKANWTGTVDGDEGSLATFVIKKNSMTGNIHYQGRVYQIRSLGKGIHSVTEIDPSKFPDELPPDQIPNRKENTPLNGNVKHPLKADDLDKSSDTQPESSIQIDVLVAYTTATEAASTNIVNEIELAVLETNTSYKLSGINQHLNLVATQRENYIESGNIKTDRDRLQVNGDSYMDSIHKARDEYSADLVVMIVEAQGSRYCGIAYIMENVGQHFAPYGFSVVKRTCATGYFSFGHELGHLMGARHDRFVDSTDNSPFKHNHGYVNVAARQRSIMAYNTACKDAGETCTRIQNWSNPNTTVNNTPFGVPKSNSSAADNRLTLNRTAPTVSSFRDTRPKPPTAASVD